MCHICILHMYTVHFLSTYVNSTVHSTHVEGVSVGLENQGQVVARVAARVAASGSELVADTECEEWHEAAGISSSPAAFPMWSVAMMTQ